MHRAAGGGALLFQLVTGYLDPLIFTQRGIVIVGRLKMGGVPGGAAILSNVPILLLLNYGMALILYLINGIPLLEDAAWLDAVGSGLLLFLVSGALPFLALVIARLRRRPFSNAIRAHYVLTAVIGAALAYGAYIAAMGTP